MNLTTRAILNLSPGSALSITDDDLATLAWESGDRPTDAAISAEVARLQSPAGQTEIANQETLAASDVDYIRVLEDLVETLIAKGTIALSDLPAGAQSKHSARRGLRS